MILLCDAPRCGGPPGPLQIRIYRERWLVPDWELRQFSFLEPGVALAGIHAYEQLVFSILVRPNILETDPGPLDARVP